MQIPAGRHDIRSDNSGQPVKANLQHGEVTHGCESGGRAIVACGADRTPPPPPRPNPSSPPSPQLTLLHRLPPSQLLSLVITPRPPCSTFSLFSLLSRSLLHGTHTHTHIDQHTHSCLLRFLRGSCAAPRQDSELAGEAGGEGNKQL